MGQQGGHQALPAPPAPVGRGGPGHRRPPGPPCRSWRGAIAARPRPMAHGRGWTDRTIEVPLRACQADGAKAPSAGGSKRHHREPRTPSRRRAKHRHRGVETRSRANGRWNRAAIPIDVPASNNAAKALLSPGHLCDLAMAIKANGMPNVAGPTWSRTAPSPAAARTARQRCVTVARGTHVR